MNNDYLWGGVSSLTTETGKWGRNQRGSAWLFRALGRPSAGHSCCSLLQTTSTRPDWASPHTQGPGPADVLLLHPHLSWQVQPKRGKVGGLFCPWVQIVFSSPVLSEIDFIFWSQSDICIFFLSKLSNWTRMTCIIGHFKTPTRRMHYVLTWRVPAHVISKHRITKLLVLKKKQFVFDSIQFNIQILSTNYVQAKQYFW